MGRTHVVMVPGFGGFDTLGSIRYYAGVTGVFSDWKKGQTDASVTLHYFDNLPTASVDARARELRAYLAKRVARGELLDEDQVCLVGHSTGGLDIRQLVVLLNTEKGVVPVDGMTVLPGDILAKIKRVAFLSVPQRGTNIADTLKPIVDSRVRPMAFEVLGVGVLRHGIERLVARFDGDTTAADLFTALRTVEREIDDQKSPVEVDAANARHTAADVSLWYTNATADFLAIHDLAVGGTTTRLVASDADHAMYWEHIETQSYATISPSPFADVPPRNETRTLGEIVELARRGTPATDAVYRAAYAACSAGPFARTLANATWLGEDGTLSAAPDMRPWENDGIVNTASTEWPAGAPVFLVRGDHGDIIGHHDRVAPRGEAGSDRHGSYDLLRSNAGFHDRYFRTVWNHVFDFVSRGAS